MKRYTKLLLIGWALLGFALAQTDSGLAGVWEGILEQEGEDLDITLRLERTERWQGTVDIPGQAVSAQPLTDIVAEGNKITFEVKGISETVAVFEGTLVGGELTGTVNQDAGRFTLRPRTAEETQPKLTEAQILELGQTFTEQLYNGDYEGLAERFTDDMREAMDAQSLERLWQQLKGQIGGEAELLEETVMFQMGLGVYQRSARFGDGKKAIVQWVVNDEGIIEGFTIRPDRSG